MNRENKGCEMRLTVYEEKTIGIQNLRSNILFTEFANKVNFGDDT